MNTLINQIEKAKPLFEAISRNNYLRAIRDGFISAMPIVLFSSIFMLVAYVPNIWGFFWDENIQSLILKPYNYSMGILAVVVAGTTAKNLTDSFNRNLPTNRQVNHISTLIAGIVGFLLISVDTIAKGSGFSIEYMGSKGLITAFAVAFLVPNVYRFCMKRNIRITMPEQVPPNISQTFTDVIPFALSILLLWIFDMIFRFYVGASFAAAVIQFFTPIFTAADGYFGLALIYGAMAMFWFVGIHGPSIVEPAVAAIYYVNIASNLDAYSSGNHAANILTPGVQQFVATLGGTGATFVITLMFAFLAKSRELKAIGRASAVPVMFGVNEPILFGAPLILNPVFFIPFIFAPIVNVWLFKAFVDILGMNSFLYVLPWTTPGPIGLILGTGIALLPILLAIVLLATDFIIYYPFFKVYDLQKVEEERAKGQNIIRESENVCIDAGMMTSKRVLVLCAGGGTSGLLANALAKGAQARDIPLITAAGSYGAHMDIMKDYDLIILAPQVASHYAELRKDTDRLGIRSIACEGKAYIDLTRDADKALAFVFQQLQEEGNQE